MAAFRIVLAAAFAATLAGPALAHDEGGRRGLDRPHWLIDRGPYDRLGTRIHRTALEDGYFGHGRTDGAGRYDYDRGYPYDYYEGVHHRDADPAAEHHHAIPRERRCETDLIPDHDAGEDVPVTICRG